MRESADDAWWRRLAASGATRTRRRAPPTERPRPSREVCREAGAEFWLAGPAGSSSSSHASRDIAQAPLRILLETSLDQPLERRRHATEIRSILDDRRNRVGHVVAGEGSSAGDHLVQHAAERPDVGALVDTLARAPVRAPCRRRSRESFRPVIAGEVIVGGHRRRSRSAPEGSSAFASPKSSTLTVPSARTLTLAGFRSRWTIPARARLRAPRRSAARSPAPRRAGCARAQCAAKILALDQFHHQGADAAGLFEAVNVRDVRMVERGEGLGFTCENGRVGRGRSRTSPGGNFSATSRFSSLVSVARNLPHPAFADPRDDFIDAEARAGCEGQSLGDYTRRLGGAGMSEAWRGRPACALPPSRCAYGGTSRATALLGPEPSRSCRSSRSRWQA